MGTIQILDSEISKKNTKMLELSNFSSDIYTKKTQILEILKLRAYLMEEIHNENIDLCSLIISSLNDLKDNENYEFIKAPEIIQKIQGHIENLDSRKNIDPKAIKNTLDEYTQIYQNHRQNLRSDIINLRDTRNYIFLGSILFLVVFLVIQIIELNYFSKKISEYLNKIPNKDYDFEVTKSNTPYIDSTLEDIKLLKKNLKVLDDAISVSLKGYNIEGTLTELFENKKFQKYLNFDRIGFATLEKDKVVANLSVSSNKNIFLKKGFTICITESDSLKNIVRTKKPRIINDLEEHLEKNPNSLSTELILKEGYKSSLTVPLIKSTGTVSGFIFFSSRKKNDFSEQDKYKVSSISEILSGVFQKNMLIEDLITNAALTFVKLVEGKDPETSNHLNRMSEYAKIISQELAKTEKYKDVLNYIYIDEIYKFSPLHDIGKVGIPDKVLLKPGRLTDEEFEIMKEHSPIGAKVLSFFENNLKKYNMNFMEIAIKIAVSHHEKWDGTGYPNGLSGTNIPLSGRIVSVADVFDALTSKRVYKEAYSIEKSINIIKDMSGSSFDPDVVEAFLNSFDKIKKVYDKLKEV